MILDYLKSGQFFESVIVILIGVLIIGFSNTLDKKILKTKDGNSRWYRSAKMIFDFINTLIIILLILFVLSINGINVGKYFRSLGVIGIIASFALQDLLKDVVMGLSIMFEGYFKVGDVVVYEGEEAKVISFNVKTTRLFLTGPETTVSVCNRNINKIGIASDWVDILIPIGYDVDLRYARNICRECTKRIERLRHVYSCDFLNTQDFEDSWIDYKIRVHCLPDKKPSVRRNSNAVIQDVFYEHDLEFPLSIKVIYNVDRDKQEREDVKKLYSEDETITVYNATGHRKRDYELGRGAAKSKVCKYDGTDVSINDAIAEAERYAISENLDNSMKLRLRLLSEELLSMTRGLPSMKEGTFYIERDGLDYDICFEADAKIGKKTRDALLEVSSDNKNLAYTGISGMISHAIDSMILMSLNDRNGLNKASMNTMEESIGRADDDYKWSYNIYKEKETIQRVEDGEEGAITESFGKSVLTKLSDDIRISVRTNHVNIRVLVKNEEDD